MILVWFDITFYFIQTQVKGLVEAKTMKIHNEFKAVKYRMIVGEIYKYAIRV